MLSSPQDTSLATGPEFVTDVDAFCGLFQRLLSSGKPYCGQLKAEQLEALFGEQAGEVGSTALMPLSRRNGGGQGDLLCRVILETPVNLNAEQKIGRAAWRERMRVRWGA